MGGSICNNIVKTLGWLTAGAVANHGAPVFPPMSLPRVSSSLLGLAAVLAFSASSARATAIFDETFDYPDGPLTTNSSGNWTTVSGTAGQMTTTGGSVGVTFSNSEDVARSIGANYSSGTLYYSALITMTAIPGTGQYGAYLMHFSDTDTGIETDFFARLYVKAVDSSTFNYGVRNRSQQGSTSDYDTVFDPTAISLNTQVAIVVKFDFTTLQSTLWINPVDENSASVTDTFAVSFAGSDQSLSRLSIRESSGIGASVIDQIKVGTEFGDVFLVAVPEPGTVSLLLGGAFLALIFVRARASQGFASAKLTHSQPFIQ